MIQNLTGAGRIVRAGALSLIAVSMLSAGPVRADPGRVQEVTSPGGLKAWLIESDTMPAVTLSVTFNGGAAQDPPDKRGVAYFVNWMINEGAGDMRAQELVRALKRVGATYQRQLTGDDYTIQFTALSKNLEPSLDLLRLMLVAPRYDEDAMARAREDMLFRIEQAEKNPGARLGEAWRSLVFAGHPYESDTLGTAESVRSITRQDLEAYRAAVMTKDNLILSVVGDIDAARLGPLLDKIFGGLPETGALRTVPWVKTTPGETKTVEMDLAQSQVLFGYALDEPLNEQTRLTAAVVSYVLGGNFLTSRLASEVRVKRGLAYTIGWSLTTSLHAHYVTGYFGAEPGSVEPALALVRTELKRLAEEGPTDKEIADTKTFLQGSLLMRLDTSAKLASRLQGLQQLGMGPDSLDTFEARIAALTPEEIREIAKKVIKPDALTVVIVGKRPG